MDRARSAAEEPLVATPWGGGMMSVELALRTVGAVRITGGGAGRADVRGRETTKAVASEIAAVFTEAAARVLRQADVVV